MTWLSLVKQGYEKDINSLSGINESAVMFLFLMHTK